MTIRQLIKAIEDNAAESILTFEGFNSKRDTELKTELLWAISDKYNGKNLELASKRSCNGVIKKAGNHPEEAAAFFVLTYGHPDPAINMEMGRIHTPREVENESERSDREKDALRLLLKASGKFEDKRFAEYPFNRTVFVEEI